MALRQSLKRSFSSQSITLSRVNEKVVGVEIEGGEGGGGAEGEIRESKNEIWCSRDQFNKAYPGPLWLSGYIMAL